MGEDERRSRIVDVAIRLAQGRGFDSVGLREVAEEAGVALGSLYKSFRSKEEIISAAVQHQVHTLRRRFERRPARGETAIERVENLFARLTRALCRRPALARAVLGALTSPESDIAGPVYAQEEEVGRIIVAALRGGSPRDVEPASVTEAERTVTFILRQVWFAGMVGWSAGLYS
ncbi:MAG TPA: TetR/AcrR family transcriptional regulator [Sandaracinaceae bacterium LLY-WYZ-13_1]|nr:TetR/AcrR family transcriptional regulator [Sandaracinaceae bacterium LLY-WYZ-13_1]